MGFRYEKAHGKTHTFAKIPCDDSVANSLVTGKIVERPPETPLVIPAMMNFSGQVGQAESGTGEQPLPMPQMEF